MEPCRLAAKNLACRRGERVLFGGLSLALSAGDACHVTGPNGSGKSSLIRIMAGLLRPFTGKVEREGRVGLIDERLALDEHMPLGRAMSFWIVLDGARDPDAVIEALHLTGLKDVPIRYLSTGQRKRAAIARMMFGKPPIWMLDEPFNGLDDAMRGVMQALIARHCDAGGIALVASHQAIDLPGATTLHLPDFAA